MEKRQLSIDFSLVAWHPLLILTILVTLNTYINVDGCKLQNATKGPVWGDELVTLGYGPPLPTPIPAVQPALSAIDLPNLHKFIQETDNATLSECNEEGVHTPLLLDSLDLALWTSIFVTATSDPEKSVANLQKDMLS